MKRKKNFGTSQIEIRNNSKKISLACASRIRLFFFCLGPPALFGLKYSFKMLSTAENCSRNLTQNGIENENWIWMHKKLCANKSIEHNIIWLNKVQMFSYRLTHRTSDWHSQRWHCKWRPNVRKWMCREKKKQQQQQHKHFIALFRSFFFCHKKQQNGWAELNRKLFSAFTNPGRDRKKRWSESW